MIVKTDNGSTYEFDQDSHVRRVNDSWELRADGDWVRLHNDPNPQVGQGMVLALDGLDSEADITFRHTSNVTEIIE